MKILWHGVAPWQPTGYGQQAAIWCEKLRDAGHTVSIVAQGGNDNCMIMDWRGIKVYPQSKDMQATALVMQGHMWTIQPDLIITLYDPWTMPPGELFAPYKTIAWVPVDTSTAVVGGKQMGGGIASGDREWLEKSKARPVAMARHGQRMLAHAGFDAPVIYHGIDTQKLWTPLEPGRRDELRAQLGLEPGTFAVGLLGMNNDRYRKALPEQILAFAKFHAKHPQSQLHIHSQVFLPGSVHLGRLAEGLGLGPADVKIANQYSIFSGLFPAEDLAKWYGCMDVVMNCSRGEGFGLAAVESQACGTPVILTNAHTGPELVGPGWLVGAQEFWNERHDAYWWTPSIKGIHDALCKARSEAAGKRAEARQFAEQFDADVIWPLWEKLIGS